MIQEPGVKGVSILAWREAFAGVGVALALASAIAGCSSGSGDNPAVIPLYEGKDNSEDQYDNACLEKTANQGDRCTKDCVTPCGYGSVGIKYCSCAGGVYTQCACRPPAGL